MLTAYLDTNIISGLAKRDLSEVIMKNVLEVVSRSKRGEVQLHTSELTQDEIDRIPEMFRYYHYVIYNLIRNVTIHPEQRPGNLVIGGFGGGNIITGGLGGGGKDPLLISIESVIPRPTDVQKARARDSDIRHLFQCKKNAIDVFWTEDRRTILNKKEELSHVGITVMSSEELINEIEKSCST